MSASREKKKRQEQVNEVTSAPQTSKSKKTGKKILTAAIAIVLVAAIVYLGMVSSGFFTTHTTAAVVNGHKLTPAMVNYFYGNTYQENASVLQYMTDPEKPLHEQEYITDDYANWQEYLVDYSLNSAASVYAIYDEAMANGFELSDTIKSNIENEEQMLAMYASMSGFSGPDAYLAAMYGTGCNLKSYNEFAHINYVVQEYSNSIYNSLDYTQEEIDAYYAENAGEFDSISYHSYTVTAEGTTAEDGTVSYTDDALAAAEEKAMAMAEASEGSEEAFREQVEAADVGHNHSHGEEGHPTLTEDAPENYLDESYRDWLTDDARQFGDTTCVFNGTDGYTVLFFVEQVDHNYLLPNVRHILVGVEDASDITAMGEAKAKAETILEEFKAGEATEDAFAALVPVHSTDSGSLDNGGLYESVAPGTMVAAFNDWCFDESRQIGDTGIVETEYGYHVMYFSGYGENYHNFMVESTMIQKAFNEWQSEIASNLTWELKNDKYITLR